MYEKFCEHEKILRTRNCRLRFIKNLLSEKSKENMKKYRKHTLKLKSEISMHL